MDLLLALIDELIRLNAETGKQTIAMAQEVSRELSRPREVADFRGASVDTLRYIAGGTTA